MTKRTNGGWQYGRWHMRNPANRKQVIAQGHYINPMLNRSQHWPYAASYAEARRISPVPNNPVR